MDGHCDQGHVARSNDFDLNVLLNNGAKPRYMLLTTQLTVLLAMLLYLRGPD